MDALALLCSLHADGPLSLKHLRARGCNDLSTLIGRSAEQLGDDLDVEPASARRLIREAKLLQARMLGDGLEAEEAPPIRSASPPVAAEPKPLRPSVPVGETVTSTVLDATDRSLVERIMAAEPSRAAAEHVAQPTAPVEEPQEPRVPVEPAPSAVIADPVVVDRAEEELAPEPQVTAEACPEPIPDQAPAEAVLEAAPEPVHGALVAGIVAGLDGDLVADLHASGINTLEDLAAAESLQLTRELGITFAQARRLGFLARRAARAVPAPAVAAATAPVPIEPEPAPKLESADAPASKPLPEAVADPVADPVAEPLPEPVPEPTPEPAAPSASESTRPFWEPRPFLSESEAPDASEQGVKVDPSEIAPRPRFSERLAEAARQRQLKDETQASAATEPGGTVVGWNFEIPRPADEGQIPLGSVAAPREAAQTESRGGSVRADGLSRDADPSGPFA